MLKFIHFASLGSTQKWLAKALKSGELSPPICVWASVQDGGIGSRGNRWESVQSALTFSFALHQSSFPQDLPPQSLSIYVGFLLKEWLGNLGFGIWLKWPNDLYLGKSKVGGVMSEAVGDTMLCGVGINLLDSDFASLQVYWDEDGKRGALLEFFDFLFKFPTWSAVLRDYKLEFHKNLEFSFHFQNHKIHFCDVSLCEDGALLWNGQKIYSLR